MTRLVTIELGTHSSNRSGRVFLDRKDLAGFDATAAEQQLEERFEEPGDSDRLGRIAALIGKGDALRVAVHPGETSPPEFHVYIEDPDAPDAPLFGCVLAPHAVIATMLEAGEPPIFETATFQGMEDDTSVPGFLNGLSKWFGRVWPGLPVPRIELRPWPIEEVHTGVAAVPKIDATVRAKGAPESLEQGDFPTEQELSA